MLPFRSKDSKHPTIASPASSAKLHSPLVAVSFLYWATISMWAGPTFLRVTNMLSKLNNWSGNGWMRGLGALPCYPWMLFLPFKEFFKFYIPLSLLQMKVNSCKSKVQFFMPCPRASVITFLGRFIVSGVDSMFSGTVYVT